jgi:hypothetical protein
MKKRCQVMSADSAEQREKSVRFGVHAFRDFRVSPNAEPDERSGSAYRPNFEPDHRSGSASVRSEPKFGTELCHHYLARLFGEVEVEEDGTFSGAEMGLVLVGVIELEETGTRGGA